MSLRLVDLLAGLSRLADLGFGMHPGESLRSCALAVALARELDLSDDDLRAALYTALLHHVGCTGYAHETTQVVGDDLAVNAAAGRTDLTDARDMFVTFLPTLTRGRPLRERARLGVRSLAAGERYGVAYTTATCEVGRRAARRLDLPEAAQRSVYHVYELWQGGGAPAALAGDDIPIPSRLARLTGIAVLFDTLGATAAAVDAVRRRAGGMLDPAMAACTHGHSSGVATLARSAGEQLGLQRPDLADLEVAGLLHDVGRVAVSNRVWEKPGRLTGPEWEQVRLHAYHSERILAGSDRLAALVPTVGMHHERLDRSGYHRSCAGSQIPLPARILAAADAYQAMTQRRPHRPALDPEQARRELLEGARRGALDPDAVTAVLAAPGTTPSSRDGRPRRG